MACNDSSNLETVQSQPLSKKDKTTLGAVLDKRPACDKVIWSETPAPEQGGDARVDYQCELSAVQVGEHFSAQRAVWVTRYQQRLDDAKARQAEIVAKKRHESSALAIASRCLNNFRPARTCPVTRRSSRTPLCTISPWPP
ncbi:hypothetical protein [Serratia fonticola]|uniref:hypothetical protein n=1 Tax=Serratia fonticola TaxID=47917 RepID=UPI0011612698|nr:hypothetical protein [Serratia fonticola]